MKRFLICTIITASILMLACKKAAYDITDPQQYTSLYIPQAADLVSAQSIYIRDTAQTFHFNAFYGGPVNPGGSVTIEFEAAFDAIDSFNTANGTMYEPMPAGSYTIATQGTIEKGKLSTGELNVAVLTKGHLEVFKPYLLPVRIKSNNAGAAINSRMSTAFFLITAGYDPGNVPRQQIGKLDNGAVQAFPYGLDENLALIVRQSDNNMYRFPVKADGTLDAPASIGIGWGAVDIFIPFDDKWVTKRNDGGMFHWLWTQTGGFAGGGNQVGWGWNNNDIIIAHKNNIYNRNKDTKALTRWPYATCFCGGVFSVGGDWSAYTQMIPFKNTILGVTASGDLWETTVGTKGEVSNTRKVGSGWDMYTKVIAFGDDLLGLDSDGYVWRYKFNPIGFWALK